MSACRQRAHELPRVAVPVVQDRPALFVGLLSTPPSLCCDAGWSRASPRPPSNGRLRVQPEVTEDDKRNLDTFDAVTRSARFVHLERASTDR